eukprot:gene28937-35891_t
MKRFLEVSCALCTPDMVFMYHYEGEQNPYGQNEATIRGVHAFADLHAALFMSAPDLVISMFDVKAKYHRTTNEAWVTFNTLISMTKTKIVQPKIMHSAGTLKAPEGVFNPNNHKQGVDSLVSAFSTFELVPLQAPVETSYNSGKYIFMLNAEGKIFQ